MKRYNTILVLALVLTQSACSYISDFVVLNDSEKPIEVRYTVKGSSYEPFQLIDEPAKTSQPNLPSTDNHWQRLTSREYNLDARIITVTVQPHEALRVESIPNYPGHDDASAADRFQINDIIITGGRGEVKIQGEQARNKFAEQSESLYLLTYK